MVHFRCLTDQHRTRVQSRLGPRVAVANNYIWNNEPAMTEAFTAMMSGGFDFNMPVIEFPRPDRCSNAASYWTILRVFEAALKINKPQGVTMS